MRSCKLILLLFLFTLTTTCALDICTAVEKLKLCGKGRCEVNASALFQFDCKCDPGWKSLNILNFTIPCFLPNCTVDSQCGKVSPLPPPASTLDPLCNILCLGGSCTPNIGALNVTCNCGQGYANVLNNPSLPCLPTCYLDGSCNNGLSPPSPTTSASAPSKGFSDAHNYSRKTFQGIMMLLWATILMLLFM